MAADWIPMRIDLRDDPAVIVIAAATQLDQDTVVGKLLRIWGWANRQLRKGDAPVTLGDAPVTLEAWIDTFVGAKNFSAAMTAAGWLATKNGKLTFPKFERWNSQSAKRRALTAERMRKLRASKRDAKGDAPVTQKVTLKGEERREENKRVAPRGGEAKIVPVPDSLRTPEFESAWASWLEDRKARKIKALTPKGAKTQLAKLAEIGPAAAVACIESSIANGYQGLFPDKFRPGSKPGFQTHDDRVGDVLFGGHDHG